MNSIQSTVIRFLIRRANLWNKPLQEIRNSMDIIKAKGIPEGVNLTLEEVNGIDCEVFRCQEAKRNKAILYFHGGGFCLGIYPPNREFVAELAKRAGVNVYMPDYRLAPEHPFPAALEDAVAVYKGMLKNGYGADDLIVAGDSAGCALSMSALLILKQGGEKMPKALVYMTPVFDLAGKGETFLTRGKKDPFQLKDPLGIAKIYSGSMNPTSPMLSPLYGELDGLPPILIHAADYDVFFSDACRFVEIVKGKGGEIELKVWRKMWHIFHMQASLVPESSQALDELSAYIKGKLVTADRP